MKRLFSTIVYSLPFLLPVAAHAAGGEAGGNDLVGFLFKVINFVALIAILYFFARKPLGEAFKNSAAQAKSDLEDAKNAKQQAEQELKNFEEKLKGMKQETESMIANAKEQAEQEKQRIIEDANVLAEKIQEQAQFAIQQETKKAQQELREWFAQELIEKVETQVKEKAASMSAEDLVQGALGDLEKTSVLSQSVN